MLAYTAFVVIRFSRRYYLLRSESVDYEPNRPSLRQADSRFLSDLIPAVSALRGIVSAAPFLGLAGTCYGFLASFQDLSGSRASVIAYLIKVLVDVPISSLAGILVAIPAAFFYSLLRERIEVLRDRLAFGSPNTRNLGLVQSAQTLPLRSRFSSPPAYALLGAPFFAVTVMMLMSFKPYVSPVGLPVRLSQDHCEPGIIDLRLVLRVTEGGKLFLNYEQQDRKRIQERLADIYGMRRDRVLYLQAEDGVPFQQVAEAISLTRDVFGTGPDSPKITVRLITPRAQAENASCHAPVWIGPTVRLQK